MGNSFLSRRSVWSPSPLRMSGGVGWCGIFFPGRPGQSNSPELQGLSSPMKLRMRLKYFDLSRGFIDPHAVPQCIFGKEEDIWSEAHINAEYHQQSEQSLL